MEKSNDTMIMKNQTPLLKREKVHKLLTNLIKERETNICIFVSLYKVKQDKEGITIRNF